MSEDTAIRVENVSKKFSRTLRKSILYGMADIGRNALGLGSRPGRLRAGEFWAVRDLSFEVRRGEMLGLVGRNGSGKTSLLRMLGGIFWPDTGRIELCGRVGALIALGAGFHPQLTGRENIFVSGAILGMSREEVKGRFDEIVDFAAIGDFLDSPVKYYSSGMFVRLGFAVAIHCRPDILLIDEVLSVGDISFQAKCIQKMKTLEREGVTRIFVSHYLSSVEILCKRTVYLSDGRMKYFGETRDVLNEYRKDMLASDTPNADMRRYGTKEIQIIRVQFLNGIGEPREIFKRGENLRIRMAFRTRNRVENPEFTIAFWSQDGVLISNPTTRDHNFAIAFAEDEGEINYLIESIPFNIGKYLVSVGCWDCTGHLAYDQHDKLYELTVEDGTAGTNIHERFGLLYIPAKWSLKTPYDTK